MSDIGGTPATTTITMLGAVLPGDSVVRLDTFAVPKPGPDEVLISTRASGICGSDLRVIYRRPASQDNAASLRPEAYQNVIAGHEPSGIIHSLGSNVSPFHFPVGSRVMVYHIHGCGNCSFCRVGAYISCSSLLPGERRAYGWQRDGGHAPYLLASAQSILVLPPPLTFLDGALVACGFGTAYAACVRANVSGRDTVLVTGLGPVGLGVALIAQKMGARVLGVEKVKERITLAGGLGIECLETTGSEDADLQSILHWIQGIHSDRSDINPQQAPSPSSLPQPPTSYATPQLSGVSVAIDSSGSPVARVLSLKALAPGGTLVLVGEGSSMAIPSVSDLIIHKGVSIVGSWVCSITQMQELLGLLVRWNLHPEVTVTNTFTLDGASDAYSIFDKGTSGKCVIVFGGEEKKFFSV